MPPGLIEPYVSSDSRVRCCGRICLTQNNIVRMGVPPLRIEILTSISGVDFDECFKERLTVQIDDVLVPVISLARLRQNKAASGRLKDLADLDGLPQA